MKHLMICLCILFSTAVFADGNDDGFPYSPNVPADIPNHSSHIQVTPKKKINLDDFELENCHDKPVPVPEPEVLGLLGIGLAAFVMMRRKQK